MLVSILIPTLDRRAMLERALASALGQTHQDLEIIVSDDGSRDGTRDYLQALCAREGRVRLAPPNPNPGLFANMNHLLEHKRGEFFCILADDDQLEPTFVERLLGHLCAQPDCVACFCGIARKNSNGDLLGHHAAKLRSGPGRLDDVVHHVIEMELLICNVLYRTSLLGTLRFDLECLGAAEKDFNLRARALGRFFYSPEPLSVAGVHPDQASLKELDFMWRGLIRVLERHRFSRPDEERSRVRALQHARTGYASTLAGTRPAACLALVGAYLSEKPSSWQPRALGSLTASTLRAALGPPRGYLKRLRAALR
jgi:glycosyltransferase involved in cell wall biosynthesis